MTLLEKQGRTHQWCTSMDPAYGRTKAGRPARTYIQQLCEDTECSPEDLPEAMNDREKSRERVRDIRASGTIWRWWWWWWLYHTSWHIVFWLLMFAGVFFRIGIFKNRQKFPIGFNQKAAQDSQQNTSNFLSRSVYTFMHSFYRLLLIFCPHLSLKNTPNHYTATAKFDSWYCLLVRTLRHLSSINDLDNYDQTTQF